MIGLGVMTTKTKLYQSGPVKDSYTGDEHLFLTGVCRDWGPYDLSVAAEANVAAVEGKFHVDLPWRIAHIVIVIGTCA